LPELIDDLQLTIEELIRRLTKVPGLAQQVFNRRIASSIVNCKSSMSAGNLQSTNFQ